MNKVLLMTVITLIYIFSLQGCVSSTTKDEVPFKQAYYKGVDGTPVTMKVTQGECEDFRFEPLPAVVGKWLNDGILEVAVYVYINCAQSIGNEGVIIEGDKIHLVFDIGQSDCNAIADCNCKQKLLYHFSNLPKKEYVFKKKVNKRDCEDY